MMLVFVVTLSSASATVEEGNELIAWQDHLAFEISQPRGEWELQWLITVDQGPKVDVLLLPQRGYEEYLDVNTDEFTYIAIGTTLQTNLSSKSFTVDLYGTHYVVIDNSEIGYMPDDEERGASTVHYYISYKKASTVGEGGSSDNDGVRDLLGGIVFIGWMLGGLLLSLVAVFFRYRRRHRVRISLSPPQPGAMGSGLSQPRQSEPRGGPHPSQYPPGGPPPQAYRSKPPPPPPPPPHRETMHHTEDSTYILQESPSMSMDTTDHYGEQLAQQNRDRKRFGG
jgi:hypothetical protein